MRIAMDQLKQAQEILLRNGFSKQHERIFSIDQVEGGRGVQCLVGMDRADDPNRLEINIRCLERPVEKGKKGADIARVRVIDLAQAPASIQSAVENAMAALARLANE
ncbi:MAG: hypothetical protein K6T81_10910 [Alicyclobacillus macrosporangiidus]|uniref:hypothetical protein n=1 Tax=Alicyclobacillus macrosporangiidus TaxID=392015 RepID=UPI0026EAAF39|nr:hypothetical protein [Alicyclobacillus macrosporangiidus]MCL6599237.1 hypothetical protein [Alicyclobacillus macrosporangiidus]